MKGDLQISRSLVRVAELLLSQIKAMGTFAIPGGASDNLKKPLINNMLLLTYVFMQSLEQLGSLRLEAGELPLLFNRTDWPPAAPIGGYPGMKDDPKPSQVVRSFMEFWDIQQELIDRPLAPGLALLRATLWQVREQGLAKGLQYLLDLQKQGYVINDLTVYSALDLLRMAAPKTVNDDALPGLFFGEPVPMEGKAWIEAKFQDLSSSKIEEMPDCRNSNSFYETLLRTAIGEVARVRNSATYDDWMLGQWRLSPLLDNVRSFFDGSVSQISPTVRPILAQLEEIRADTGMIRTFRRQNFCGHPLRADLIATRHLIDAFKELRPRDWKNRVCQDRALVPEKLKDYLLNERDDPKPAGWQYISAELAPAFSRVVLGEDLFDGWGLTDDATTEHMVGELKKLMELQ